MHRKTRIHLVTLAACAFVAGMLALPGLLPAPTGGTVELAVERKANVSPQIKPAAATGNKAVVVILLKFTDKSYGAGKTTGYYQDLLFNFGNPLSMASYYREASYGRLNLTGTVTSWLTSSRTMSYYGADSGPFPNIDDKNGNIFELAREAVQLADPSVNFAPYDQDSDGYIDNLVVIHAGSGQESSGSANDIWSHQWDIQPAYTTSDSGKKASHYALFAEDSPVGVIAHEFGHVLGLPDMYDYSYSGQVFVGNWALMDAGSWNGEPYGDPGTRPSHPMSWSKMQLGFITPSERCIVGINDEKTITILPTSNQTKTLPTDTYRCAVINISTGIYYTVEVRANDTIRGGQFECALPDKGVLVTFCNDSATDEVFEGRPGVCVVQNANPWDTTKDHAPYDIGENPKFEDKARNIKVELVSYNSANGAYTVRISHIQLRVYWFYVNSTDVWRTYESQTYNLTVSLQNTGTTTLSSVSALLIAPPAGVTSILDSTVPYGSIPANTISNGSARFRVQNAASIASSPLNFTLNVTFNGGTNTTLKLQVPVWKEGGLPSTTITTPADGTGFQASELFLLQATASDPVQTYSGIFKTWYRNVATSGLGSTWWTDMDFNGTHAIVLNSIRTLGNYTIIVRVMDKSGNIDEDSVDINIYDTMPPTVLLSVNTADTGDPSHFSVVGTKLYIVAVALDNNEIAEVEISINGGDFFSILAYPATVNMGVNGTSVGGYAYPWTPSIEGDQLIKLRARDASGNEASTEWQITTISMQTITTIIVIVVVIIMIFSVIANVARRRNRTYRSRYYYRRY